MIDAKELRIGNWVKVNTEFQLDEETLFIGWSFYKSRIKPIPLTEGELLKFGFEYLKPKAGTQGVYTLKGYNVCLSNGGNVYKNNKLIPYVHTLQNKFYFDKLTGEELTRKELTTK